MHYLPENKHYSTEAGLPKKRKKRKKKEKRKEKKQPLHWPMEMFRIILDLLTLEKLNQIRKKKLKKNEKF